MSQNRLTVTSVFAGLLSSSMSVLYCAAPLATVVQVTQTKSTCTVLYCTVLYCTVLYCTVLYCTAGDPHKVHGVPPPPPHPGHRGHDLLLEPLRHHHTGRNRRRPQPSVSILHLLTVFKCCTQGEGPSRSLLQAL